MRAGKEGVRLTMIEGGFAGLRRSGPSIRTAFVSFVRHSVNHWLLWPNSPDGDSAFKSIVPRHHFPPL